MPRFRKEILKPGDYRSPDGNITISQDRMNHWVNSFQKMRASGLKIPLPWGHQSSASPKLEETPEEKEFRECKYNAGYVENLEIDKNGTLSMIIDVPRDEDASRVGTSIQEVSPQIETAWKDGKGKTWADVITHVALVTHPVVSGQNNFEQIEENKLVMRLSLKDYIEDKKMAKEDEKKPDEKKTEVKHSGVDSELLDLLAEIGLVLPDDTTENTFKECLKTAALTMKHKLEELEGEDHLKDLELPLEEPTGDKEQPTVTPPPVPEKQPPVKEEQPTMQMSLTTDEDVVTRLSLAEKKLEESDRKNLNNDIELLLRTGRITPVVANKLRNDVKTKYKLSLNSTDSPIVAMIDTFKLLPEGNSWSQDEKVRLRNVQEEAIPTEFANLSDEDADRIADQQLKKTNRNRKVSLSI